MRSRSTVTSSFRLVSLRRLAEVLNAVKPCYVRAFVRERLQSLVWRIVAYAQSRVRLPETLASSASSRSAVVQRHARSACRLDDKFASPQRGIGYETGSSASASSAGGDADPDRPNGELGSRVGANRRAFALEYTRPP